MEGFVNKFIQPQDKKKYLTNGLTSSLRVVSSAIPSTSYHLKNCNHFPTLIQFKKLYQLPYIKRKPFKIVSSMCNIQAFEYR